MNRRKNVIVSSALICGLALLAGGTAMAAAPAGTYITSERAQEIALADAKLNASDVTFIRTHMDYEDGRAEYEVEFYQGNMEYDYEIDAATGIVLAYDHDAEYDTSGNKKAGKNTTGKNTVPSSEAGADYITQEAAKQAALTHAGVLESDARGMETGFDYEHGIAVYELEWRVGRTEYSYEIDAVTGEVVRYETEYDD